MNARFWVRWADSWVKLTVRPGASVRLTSGGATEEGYHFSGETYSNDGAGVLLEWGTESRDCDGRFDQAGESYCPLADLRTQECYPAEPGVMLPAWQIGERSQRDYTAEACGY